VLLVLTAAGTAAQELTPRAYWPAPKGTKVAVLGYVHAYGDVFLDASIPIYGMTSRVNVFLAAYLQTFSLWGRTANVLVEVPYTSGSSEGILVDTPAQGDFFGFGDLGLTVSVNLLGAPTMTPADFQAFRADPRPIVGASLKILAPTGQYNSDRLLNVGANRWAARLNLGSIFPLHERWLLELEAGVWVFGDDDEFIAGRKEQDPILSLQAHVVRRFRPGFWASLDLNYFNGGRQTIDGQPLRDLQQNSRIGGSLAIPVRRGQAIKLAYATGLFTDFGTDFDQYGLSYTVIFR
jgi:hypothetical protein